MASDNKPRTTDADPDSGSYSDAEPGDGFDVDVVVVGGGPVGVTGALALARRGLSVRLYEKAETVYDLPRAIGMDAEIQRLYQQLGLLEELRARTTPIEGAEFVDVAGARIMGGDIPADAVSPLGHHPTVMFHQPAIEQMLRTGAAEAGADLRLGVEIERVTQDEHGVDIHPVTASGERPCRARWLLAADGAASPIRKALGIGFEDQGFDQDWLVFDVELHRAEDRPGRLAQQICDPARPATYVPGHGRFIRWEFRVLPGETPEEMTNPERVWQLIEPWIEPSAGELSRAVVYRFHATVAERFRHDRVFLVGDAAHQMPPFLGQGLCSGLRDVANLAWKLELVASGRAGVGLLDTYEEERRPHAKAVVSHAADVGRLIDQLSGRVESGVGMDAGYGGGRGFPAIETGVLVSGSPRVGRPFPQPTVNGERFDDRLGDGFAVVVHDPAVVAPEVSETWAGVGGRVVAVPDGVPLESVPPDGAVVVRPDRYIAATCADGAELAQATEVLVHALRRGGAESIA